MRWLQSPPTPASIYLAWPAQKLLMSGPGHNFDHGGPWSQQQLLDSAYVHAVARLQTARANQPNHGLQAVPSNLCNAPHLPCRTHANCYSGPTWRLTLRAMKVAFWKSFILLSIFFFFMAKTSGASTLSMTCTQASTQ